MIVVMFGIKVIEMEKKSVLIVVKQILKEQELDLNLEYFILCN